MSEMKAPTKSQRKALRILREHGSIRPREFAKLMWPDSPGWERVARCGHGSHQGGGMYTAGGAFLGKLCRAYPDVICYIGWERGYGIADSRKLKEILAL